MTYEEFVTAITPFLRENGGVGFCCGKAYNESGIFLMEYPLESEVDFVCKLVEEGYIEIIDDLNMQFLTRSKLFSIK